MFLVVFGCRLRLGRLGIRRRELRTGPLPHVRRLVGRRCRGRPLRLRFHLPECAQQPSESSTKKSTTENKRKNQSKHPPQKGSAADWFSNIISSSEIIAKLRFKKKKIHSILFDKRACGYWMSLCEALSKSLIRSNNNVIKIASFYCFSLTIIKMNIQNSLCPSKKLFKILTDEIVTNMHFGWCHPHHYHCPPVILEGLWLWRQKLQQRVRAEEGQMWETRALVDSESGTLCRLVHGTMCSYTRCGAQKHPQPHSLTLTFHFSTHFIHRWGINSL